MILKYKFIFTILVTSKIYKDILQTKLLLKFLVENKMQIIVYKIQKSSSVNNMKF